MSDINSLVLINMYSMGFITNKGEDTMNIIRTCKNDYNIKLERNKITHKSWITNNGSNYICSFTIYDNISNRELISFIVNEVDILVLLDNLNEFMSSNLIFNEYLITGKSKYNLNIDYTLTMIQEYNNYYISNPDCYLLVNEIDKIANTNTNRLKIYFDEDTISILANLIFSTFLLDIDNDMIDEVLDEMYNNIL